MPARIQRDLPAEVLVRYCARELEDGTRCGHHLVVHRGACTGLNPWGDPCGCPGYVPPENAEPIRHERSSTP